MAVVLVTKSVAVTMFVDTAVVAFKTIHDIAYHHIVGAFPDETHNFS